MVQVVKQALVFNSNTYYTKTFKFDCTYYTYDSKASSKFQQQGTLSEAAVQRRVRTRPFHGALKIRSQQAEKEILAENHALSSGIISSGRSEPFNMLEVNLVELFLYSKRGENRRHGQARRWSEHQAGPIGRAARYVQQGHVLHYHTTTLIHCTILYYTLLHYTTLHYTIL